MKLALFTPINKKSAIARAMVLVTAALYERGHEIQIIRTEKPDIFNEPVYDFFTKPLHWDDFATVESNVRNVEGIIYQVGDNGLFHEGVLPWLQKLPGIVCLHDFFLGNFFNNYSHSYPKEAKKVLQTWYGNDVPSLSTYQDVESLITGMSMRFPMTEWICSMAAGVITHSDGDIERVLSSCPGPVHVVPLPYYDEKIDMNVVKADSEKKPFKLLTIGHVNFNKRVDKVIEAIGLSPVLREHIVYIVAGAIVPEVQEQLYDLSHRHKVNLQLWGEVNEGTLNRILKESDAVSCLRWPVLEAASASTIEGMLYAKPVMVTNAGFYSNLPDNCVKKVDPNDEVKSIAETLKWFYENAELREDLGRAAQQWATKTFTAENYAQELLTMASALHKAKPLIEASQFFVKMMREWGASERVINLEDTLRPLSIFEVS